MAIRNNQVGRKHGSTTVTGVDTNSDGDVTDNCSIDELRGIESPEDVEVSAVGGYTANVQSVSGNEPTVRIFESAGSNAAHSSVDSGSDVTDIHIQATGY